MRWLSTLNPRICTVKRLWSVEMSDKSRQDCKNSFPLSKWKEKLLWWPTSSPDLWLASYPMEWLSVLPTLIIRKLNCWSLRENWEIDCIWKDSKSCFHREISSQSWTQRKRFLKNASSSSRQTKKASSHGRTSRWELKPDTSKHQLLITEMSHD